MFVTTLQLLFWLFMFSPPETRTKALYSMCNKVDSDSQTIITGRKQQNKQDGNGQKQNAVQLNAFLYLQTDIGIGVFAVSQTG